MLSSLNGNVRLVCGPVLVAVAFWCLSLRPSAGTAACTVSCDTQTCIGIIQPGVGTVYIYWDVAPSMILLTDTPQGGTQQNAIQNQFKIANNAGFWCPNPPVNQYTKSDYCFPTGEWEPFPTTKDCVPAGGS
jgi:hypothetical protein